MAIQMIGIDHTKAVIDIRTIFSFTKKRSAEALKLYKGRKRHPGLCSDLHL